MFGIDVGSLPSDCVGIPEPFNIKRKGLSEANIFM